MTTKQSAGAAGSGDPKQPRTTHHAGHRTSTVDRALASVPEAFPETMTVHDLQEEMTAGRLTSVELTRRCLERIDRLNPVLRAVISVNPRALDEARASDRRRASGETLGPLDGVPVLPKDSIDVAGLATTVGSEVLRHALPTSDARLVTRLRRGGAVIIGKANLSEWCNYRTSSGIAGWSAVGGQTRNPYVLDRTPNGSSSGSAVAPAAGMVPLAIGTDTSGSIIAPAAANGVVGFRPSLGRVSGIGLFPISPDQDTAGPIARHVADAAAVFEVIAETCAPIRLDAEPRLGTRIGVWRGIRFGGSLPDVDRVFGAAIAKLRDLGVTTVEVELPDPDTSALLPYEFKEAVNAYLALRGGEPRDLAELIALHRGEPAERERVRELGLTRFEAAQAAESAHTPRWYREERHRIVEETRRSIDGVFAEHRLDAVIAPSNGPAWKILGPYDYPWVYSFGPAAVAGYPVITVPAGHAYGALPLGVSLIGRGGDDERLLGLANVFEQATQARTSPRYLTTLPE
ncbi:amidase family protein [Actinoallomurus sp. NPDC052274]|uniref:amidase family protein n=1 Tax=Actinoallomurus sp. NPDC052274 TaxID=3155420 RepID=UPI00343EC2A7